MSIDPYALCPCGSGKKLKFCCKDLKQEMEKIQRLFEAEQLVACLEYVKGLVKKHPSRASLLAMQSYLQRALEQFEDAAETVAAFKEQHPRNPMAWAEAAAVAAENNQIEDAVETLQQAVELSDDELAGRLYESIGLVARTLLSEGYIFAAHAHFAWMAELSRGEDERVLDALSRIQSAEELPLLLRDIYPLSPCREEAPRKREFDAALRTAGRGLWIAAARRFEELATENRDFPQAFRNAGLLWARSAKTLEALRALRKFATLDVPLDDAIEAQALANLLDPDCRFEQVGVVQRVRELDDIDGVVERLVGDGRFRPDADPSENWTSDGPPPRMSGELADRPIPPRLDGVALTDIPRFLALIQIFGRQTDRPARLVYTSVLGEPMDQAEAVLQEIGGDSLSEPVEDEQREFTSASRFVLELFPRLSLPEHVTREEGRRLDRERQREAYLERWPQLALPQLRGKTPQEASDDPALRVPLLAAILEVESDVSRSADAFDVNELRDTLGLPRPQPVRIADLPDGFIPLVRLARLELDGLSDEQLAEGLWRALHGGVPSAVKRLGRELLRRESTDDKTKVTAVAALLRFEEDIDEQLRLIPQGRQAAERARQSCGLFDIAEVSIRIRRGEVEDFQRLVAHITSEHAQEKQIMQQLQSILYALQSTAGPDAVPDEQTEDAAGATVHDIWTPASAGAASGSEKKLWVPGS